MANPSLDFSYADWKSQTARLFTVRSSKLQALDILVDSYIKTPSDNNLRFLKRAFADWKASKGDGDEWFASQRNDKRYYAVSRLNALLDGTNDTDSAFGVNGALTHEMISARLGLLYLFSHTDCAPDYFSVTTSGVLDLSGAGMDLAGDLSENAKPVLEKVKAGIGLARENFIDEKVAELDKGRSSGTPLPSGSIPLGKGNTPYGMTLEEMRTVSSGKLLNAPSVALNPDANKISRSLFDGVKHYSQTVLDYWDDKGGAQLRKLTEFLVKQFVSSPVVGIVGGSMSIVPHTVKLVEAGYQRYRSWELGHRTAIQPGVPTAIVDGVKRGMDLGLATHLYNTIKGGAQLGMTITSAGASVVVNAVLAIMEILVKAAWRLAEIHYFRVFLREARAKWEARGAQPIHQHPIEFNRWYRPHALKVPLVAALSINCGFCHNMTFLQMFDEKKDGASVITQAQYTKAMASYAQLKQFASKYIEETKYGLSTNDGVVAQGLKPGVREAPSGLRKHLIDPMLGFMGG